MKKIILLSTLIIFNIQMLCAQFSFLPAVNYAVSSSSSTYTPYSVKHIDMNNDGIKDLITGDYIGYISILLGNSLGGFNTATTFPAPYSNYDIEIADFNNDGHLDVISASGAGNQLFLYLGNGLGGLSYPTSFSVVNTPEFLTKADFNNDGKMDVATANYNTNNIAILLGTGTGSFSAAVYFASGTSCYGIESADLNNDGKIDIVTSNPNSNSISVHLGNGVGGFTLPANFSSGLYNVGITLADFNEDGKLDIATANFNANNISILIGDGLGSFSAPTQYSLVGSIGPHDIIAAYLDCDNHLDIAVANTNSNNITIIKGNGLGSFTSSLSFGLTGINPTSLTASDINIDGKIDIIVTNANSNNVSVFTNNIICNPPLPITLLNFTAKAIPSNQAILNWETENEINFSHFDIERSNDGKYFNKIGSIEKNSNQVYSFTDEFPFSKNYYRLKMVDADSKFEYSKTENVNFNNQVIRIFPNPSISKINIESGAKIIAVSIMEMNGTTLMEQKNANNIIDISSLSNGLYFIKVKTTEGLITQKFTKE